MVYRRRARRMAPRNVIQSQKVVITSAPASRAAAAVISHFISTGVDAVAAGQTTATDDQVPTGSVIKYIEIQYSTQNLVNIAAFMSVSVQRVHTGQTAIDPRAVGGSPQRNQVHFQKIYSIGQNQNQNVYIRFKVPKKFQRVREGDKWQFVIVGDQIHTDNYQCIYKYYR